MIVGSFDTDKEILIVAEIGNNHEGSYALAKEMIRLAAKAGAGAVKFQTIVPDKLISADQKQRLKQLKKFSLSYNEFKKLHKVAREEKVLFLSTPFDIESAQFLNSLVPAFKISSSDNNFLPLIDFVASTAKPIILSTGLAKMDQILHVRNYIQGIWRKSKIKQELAVLHCVTSYPVRPEEANLLAIRTLSKQLGLTVGYSDHTIGIDACVLSVAFGARIIEKHFTISKNFSDFHDHKISADPEDFALLVKKVKQAVEMLGDGVKRLQDSEREISHKLRRSIAAKFDLPRGTVLNLSNITWLRAGKGLGIGSEGAVIGKTLTRPIRRGETILLEDVAKIIKKYFNICAA